MAKSKRRFRFSLLTMFIVVTLIAIISAWFGAESRDAAERRELIALLERRGAHAYCVYEVTKDGVEFNYGGPRVDMERTRLGHLFQDVAYDPVRVLDLTTRRFDREADWDNSFGLPFRRYQGLMRLDVEDVLKDLKRFPSAKEIHLVIAAGSDLNDETITLLEQFPELKHVDVVRTNVTDQGLRKLIQHENLVSLTVDPDMISEETARFLFNKTPSLQSIILPTLPVDLFNHMGGPGAYEILRRAAFVETP